MVEIVHAILPSNPTFKPREGPYINRANIRKRRSVEDDAPCMLMDNAQTLEIKNKRHQKCTVPMLLSFLIFYVCIINVIIKCDSSVSDVDKYNYRHVSELREKIKYWHGHRHDDRLYGKNLRKGRTSSKRQADSEEKIPEAQELKKYYDYYRNKGVIQNITDNPLLDMGTDVYDNTRAVGFPHDLAANPYYVKNINFNLRMERHQFGERVVKLGVLLPADPGHIFSLAKVLPILEMAVPAITSPQGPLPGWTVLVDYRDTRCSSVNGPLAAFEFYVNGSADAFIGPGCEYVIAPVARYASAWSIPVLTAGAQAEAFGYKSPSYETLIRMMGSYTQAAVAIRKIFEEFNWRRYGMLYHNNDLSTGKGNSPCFMILSAIFTVLQKKTVKGSNLVSLPFDETNTTSTKFKEMLHKLTENTRTSVMASSLSATRLFPLGIGLSLLLPLTMDAG